MLLFWYILLLLFYYIVNRYIIMNLLFIIPDSIFDSAGLRNKSRLLSALSRLPAIYSVLAAE